MGILVYHFYDILCHKNDANYIKKSLKIPKGIPEFVNRRGTDNTMAKRKMDKRKNNDLQNIHIKQTKERAIRNPL